MNFQNNSYSVFQNKILIFYIFTSMQEALNKENFCQFSYISYILHVILIVNDNFNNYY